MILNKIIMPRSRNYTSKLKYNIMLLGVFYVCVDSLEIVLINCQSGVYIQRQSM